MRIPSDDDLTPSIPDVSPGEVGVSTAALLAGPERAAVRPPAVGAASPGPRHLFAALHAPVPVVAGVVRATALKDRGLRPAEALAAIARDFSPRIERHPGGTVVLDVSGLQRLLGDARAIAGHLARAGAPRAAVAASQTAAMLLARDRPGATAAPGDPAAALSEVGIAVLQRLRADEAEAAAVRPALRPAARAACERTFDVLRRWGIRTLAELAALPAGELAARLGPEGVALQRRARGLDARPLVPDPGVARFTGTFELEWPIDTLEPLSFVFARLLDPLAAALERADRGAAALHLELRLTDRTVHARTLPLPAAMRDPRVLRTLLLLDLESHPPPAAVDVVTIEIDPAPARIVQYSLLDRAVPSSETLATLMARLGALVGETRCGSPALLDTHRPDGFALGPPAFGDTGGRAGGTAGGALPAAPSGALTAGVVRRFRPPVAVRVEVADGRPVHVAVDRRGMPGGAVRQAAGPWRASGGWWEPERWNRDEWDVALGDGAVCRLLRDRDGGQWFMDGVFD